MTCKIWTTFVVTDKKRCFNIHDPDLECCVTSLHADTKTGEVNRTSAIHPIVI